MKSDKTEFNPVVLAHLSDTLCYTGSYKRRSVIVHLMASAVIALGGVFYPDASSAGPCGALYSDADCRCTDWGPYAQMYTGCTGGNGGGDGTSHPYIGCTNPTNRMGQPTGPSATFGSNGTAIGYRCRPAQGASCTQTPSGDLPPGNWWNYCINESMGGGTFSAKCNTSGSANTATWATLSVAYDSSKCGGVNFVGGALQCSNMCPTPEATTLPTATPGPTPVGGPGSVVPTPTPTTASLQPMCLAPQPVVPTDACVEGKCTKSQASKDLVSMAPMPSVSPFEVLRNEGLKVVASATFPTK